MIETLLQAERFVQLAKAALKEGHYGEVTSHCSQAVTKLKKLDAPLAAAAFPVVTLEEMWGT